MPRMSSELVQRVKELMVAEKVVLSDDLNQAEAAVLDFVQRMGTELLNEHFEKKRWAMKGRVATAVAARSRSS